MALVWPDGIPGAAELREWYGGYPGFHDAHATFVLSDDGKAFLKVRGHRTTDRVDDKGFFVLEKPFLATFLLEDLASINLSDIRPDGSILFDLDIFEEDGHFVVEIGSSYGFSGSIHAGKLSVSFEPQVHEIVMAGLDPAIHPEA